MANSQFASYAYAGARRWLLSASTDAADRAAVAAASGDDISSRDLKITYHMDASELGLVKSRMTAEAHLHLPLINS